MKKLFDSRNYGLINGREAALILLGQRILCVTRLETINELGDTVGIDLFATFAQRSIEWMRAKCTT